MQICKETDMTYQTLKFYCNEGLIPNVKRDKNNRRIFDEHDLNWIKDLTCLKRCGMSIQEMKEYVTLCLQGEKSIPQRLLFLKTKQNELCDEKKRLDDSIAYINWKQNLYTDILSGKRPYISNLVKQKD